MDTGASGLSIFMLILLTLSSTTALPSLFGLDELLQSQAHNGEATEPVKFLYFTSSETGEGNVYRDVTNDLSMINSSMPYVIIVHGFMGNPYARSTQLLIQAYLDKGGHHVIAVDYKDLAKGPWYATAAEGSFIAAKQLANWMYTLVQSNYTTWPDIHIVGFSLGAHTAGLTRKYLPEGVRVGRLTGLDPARPFFDEKTPEDRLDPEDSDFTTIVHSCDGFLAFPDPLGHVDFYPNGGLDPQPPCKEDALRKLLKKHGDEDLNKAFHEGGPTQLFSGLVCSHYMSLALWVESLTPKGQLVAKECGSWQDFLDEKCTNGTEAIMGESTPRSTRGTYYMTTEEDVSFAPVLTELIADGLKEYTKLSVPGTTQEDGQGIDGDKGRAEIQDISPGREDHNVPGVSDDNTYDANSIDETMSKASSRTYVNYVTILGLVFITCWF